jgi:hypothetical protein
MTWTAYKTSRPTVLPLLRVYFWALEYVYHAVAYHRLSLLAPLFHIVSGGHRDTEQGDIIRLLLFFFFKIRNIG